jgi:hypothetical protein
MSDDLPDGFVPDGTQYIGDPPTCDDCGTVAEYGAYHGGEWLCRWCDFQRRDEITEVVGQGATCTCGIQVRFRSRETDRRVCPRCHASFRPRECPECGEWGHIEEEVCGGCLGDKTGGEPDE